MSVLLRYLVQWWFFRRVRVKAARQAYREAQAALEHANRRRDSRSQHQASDRLCRAMNDLLRAEQACGPWGRS